MWAEKKFDIRLTYFYSMYTSTFRNIDMKFQGIEEFY